MKTIRTEWPFSFSEEGYFGFPAPAKLNLMLKIVGQRDDGYHLLETVFRFIDRYDTIWIKPRRDREIILESHHHGILPEQNLVVRAARLLQNMSGTNYGAHIFIEKNLPMGGGLGGGSSDAATTLIALNHLWQTEVFRHELQAASVQLGADVPVFLFGRAAFASGIGEELSDCEVPQAWYVVLTPKVHVSTAAIFSEKNLTRNSPPSIMRSLETTDRCNALQDVVLSRFPEVRQCFDALAQFGKPMMTGSGACVFLECTSQDQAESVFAKLDARYSGFVAQGLDDHPLLGLDN